MRFPTSTTLKVAMCSSALLLFIGALGCGSSSSSLSSGSTSSLLSGAPVTATMIYARGTYPSAYVNDVVGFNVASANDSIPAMSLTMPSNYLPGAITTDLAGKIYVQAGYGLYVYAANAVGNAAPLRTIVPTDGSQFYSVAVDATGQIYALTLNTAGNSYVDVFSATANGNVAPIRTLPLGPESGAAENVALDGQGNLYANTQQAIEVFAPGSTTPSRVIPAAGNLGMAVDAAGNLYIVNDSGQIMSVTEYPAGSPTLSNPINVIQLPSISERYSIGGYNSSVSLDAAGNIYVSSVFYDETVTPAQKYQQVYGYHPGAAGVATPFLTVATSTAEPGGFAVN